MKIVFVILTNSLPLSYFTHKIIDFETTKLAFTLNLSPFEWVPEQLSRFLTDPTIATLLEHPGQ
jgi:hypothetical protein